jgi:hypothetical protein
MKPIFLKPDLTRYTQRPFPPYRYLPYQKDNPLPHPRNDWRTCESYLYGIDLFNHGYWWEAHEALETVWIAAGHKSTDCGIFVQGLIQLAGAQLKRFIDEPRGAQSLTRSGIEKISFVEGVYLGIEVVALVEDVERCLKENCGVYPRIELRF